MDRVCRFFGITNQLRWCCWQAIGRPPRGCRLGGLPTAPFCIRKAIFVHKNAKYFYIGFLRTYSLDKRFKLNIEANHATLAGHSFQHELCVARINGLFGSIDANQGDMLLGWDTDQFPTNVYDAALCMLEVLRAGGFTNGGLNFDAKVRRGSFKPEDWFEAYIAGMDTFALGLLLADRIIKDGRMDAFVADRYSSWTTGIGQDIIDGKMTLESLADYALAMGEVTTNISGGQERLEAIINQIMFGGIAL